MPTPTSLPPVYLLRRKKAAKVTPWKTLPSRWARLLQGQRYNNLEATNDLVPAMRVGMRTAIPGFAVSGASGNCGDVIMPGIAAGAIRDQAPFYWHLGDLRAIFEFDEDMQRGAEIRKNTYNVLSYESATWDDFIENQIAPFKETHFFLGIGNHEMIPRKNREQFIQQFADWLDTPALRDQRRADDPTDRRLRTYYHWMQGGVDFINLGNATPDQFDSNHLTWFSHVIDRDAANSAVKTVVVGMHKALPFRMSESGEGERSDVKVYQRLLDLQNRSHKNV